MQPRDLSAHSEYVPGRGVEEVARDLGVAPEELIKLSSNENPHGPSPAAVEAAREAAAEAHVYPKAAHTDLTAALADEWDVTDEQVWVSPGADGALDYLARATLAPGDTVLVPDPGFAYYPMSARYHHGQVSTYDLDETEAFQQDAATVLDAYDGERIVYLTSPHNPTGTEFPREQLHELLPAVEEETLIVVDEAYGEYTEQPSAIGLVAEYDNLAVTRTFSKAYGLAGLRVGYAVVPSAWGDAYARINTPFAANAVALAAANAALADDDHVERSVDSARWARDYLAETLGVPTVDSAGNFLLAYVGPVDADAAADLLGTDSDGDSGDRTGDNGDQTGNGGGRTGDNGDQTGDGGDQTGDGGGGAAATTPGAAVAAAAQRRGVIVRDTASFGLPEYVRISCGTREETRAAAETLNEVFADLGAAAYDPEAAGGVEVDP